jgi:hypothetical protein
MLVNLAMSIIAIPKERRILGGLLLLRWREERLGFVGGGHGGLLSVVRPPNVMGLRCAQGA